MFDEVRAHCRHLEKSERSRARANFLKKMADGTTTHVVQVTNISHNVSGDQIKHFLEYIGRVKEVQIFPEGYLFYSHLLPGLNFGCSQSTRNTLHHIIHSDRLMS